MENKKKHTLSKRIFIVLLVMFLCLYSISLVGYKDRTLEEKTFYTEEMIEKFEKDVQSGKEIDIDDYFTYEEKNYANKASDLGENISKGIEIASEKSLELFSNFLNYLFD